jgi:hypothetical protein
MLECELRDCEDPEHQQRLRENRMLAERERQLPQRRQTDEPV